jgi:hypothetical protein
MFVCLFVCLFFFFFFGGAHHEFWIKTNQLKPQRSFMTLLAAAARGEGE